MSRPATISEEQIIEAARAVFLARGIQATTADVAERAGVSEGSIFNRFKSKAELFQAAMRGDIEPAWLAGLERRAGKGKLPEQLYELGLEIIAFFQKIMPLNMMAWSNTPCESGLPRHLDGRNPPPLRGLRAMARFFEAEMNANRMRRGDPELVARAFLGALHGYAFFHLLYQANDEIQLPAESYVRGLVHLIWTGAKPRPGGK